MHFAVGLVLLIILLACGCAFALDPSLDISQYAHTSWKVRDGFAKGQIILIAQTPDGYLWLGTEFGLLRFDGVRAVPWQPPRGEQLPSSFAPRGAAETRSKRLLPKGFADAISRPTQLKSLETESPLAAWTRWGALSCLFSLSLGMPRSVN